MEAWGQELVPLPNKTGGGQTAECWELVPSRGRGRGTASREGRREGALCKLVTEQFTQGLEDPEVKATLSYIELKALG